MKRLLCVLGLVALPCSAQVRTFAIDVRPIGGLISLGWRAAPQQYIGIGVGAGTDEFGHTLRPRDDQDFHDLEQLLYLDLFYRYKPQARFDIDVGLRGGIGEVRSCNASDCLPGAFGGGYVGVFAGSQRWKLGTRLVIARVREASYTDNVVHWELISLRYSR